MKVRMIRNLGQSGRAEDSYLRLTDAAALRGLQFAPRRRIDGRFAGRHATTQRGRSVEFNDYRAYLPGDPVSDIDWKVFARSDHLLVRQYEHQSDLTMHIVIDASGSMAFAGLEAQMSLAHARALSKFDHAARTACIIGLLAQRQRDRFALHIAQEGNLSLDLPTARMARLIGRARTLESTEPAGATTLANALEALHTTGSVRRAVVIVLSDLYEDRDRVLASLDRLVHAGAEAIVFQTLHPDEITLPDLGEALFVDAEGAGEIRLNPGAMRDSYNERMQALIDDWRRALTGRGIDHTIARTDREPQQTLAAYLQRAGGRSG